MVKYRTKNRKQDLGERETCFLWDLLVTTLKFISENKQISSYDIIFLYLPNCTPEVGAEIPPTSNSILMNWQKQTNSQFFWKMTSYIEKLINYLCFCMKNKKLVVGADFELNWSFLLCVLIVLTFGGMI